MPPMRGLPDLAQIQQRRACFGNDALANVPTLAGITTWNIGVFACASRATSTFPKLVPIRFAVVGCLRLHWLEGASGCVDPTEGDGFSSVRCNRPRPPRLRRLVRAVLHSGSSCVRRRSSSPLVERCRERARWLMSTDASLVRTRFLLSRALIPGRTKSAARHIDDKMNGNPDSARRVEDAHSQGVPLQCPPASRSSFSDRLAGIHAFDDDDANPMGTRFRDVRMRRSGEGAPKRRSRAAILRLSEPPHGEGTRHHSGYIERHAKTAVPDGLRNGRT